jgi:hypothetical protein
VVSPKSATKVEARKCGSFDSSLAAATSLRMTGSIYAVNFRLITKSRFITSTGVLKCFPQGLKPAISLIRCGTTEVVPFQNRVMKQLLVFFLAGAEHEIADGFARIFAFVEDQLHLLCDGHFDAMLAGEAERGVRGEHAFGDFAAKAREDFG